MIRRGLPLCCILSIAGSCLAQTAPPPADIQAIAERAYTFAYPLVLTEQTRRAGGGAENHFLHLLRFPDNTFRVVVRPNVDTLYSLAYIDVSRQPVVLHLPDTKGRYYLMHFMDAWTETFSVPGKRTTGTNEKWIALVGPGWRGSLPPRMLRIEAPTNLVVLIGRTQTNGPSDYPAVHEIQKGYVLMTLGQYQSNPNVSESATPSEQVGRAAVPPPVEVARMTPIEFFRQFALLLERNPPHRNDEPMMRELARIGIEAGKPFPPETLDKDGIVALEKGARAASDNLEEAVRRFGSHSGPTAWLGFFTVGRYGTDYQARAIVARVAFGALPPEDAVYLLCTVDANGKALDGNRAYRMHFDKDALPPVRAFWSVAMYDEAGYFVENPIQRFAIGDRDALQFNTDGSLDLYIGHNAPGGAKDANWLPAPASSFNLAFRLYWPKDEIVKGKWNPPAVNPE